MLRKEEEKNYTLIFSRIKFILLIQFSAEYLPNRCDLLTCAQIKESCLKIIQDWHFFFTYYLLWKSDGHQLDALYL